MNSDCEAIEAGGIGCIGAIVAGVGLLWFLGALVEQSLAGAVLAAFATCIGSTVFVVGADSGRRPPHPAPAVPQAIPERPRFRRRHREMRPWRRAKVEVPLETRGVVPSGSWGELWLALVVVGVAALVRGAGSWWTPMLLSALVSARMLAFRRPAPRFPAGVLPRNPRPSSTTRWEYVREARLFASAGLHRLREEPPA